MSKKALILIIISPFFLLKHVLAIDLKSNISDKFYSSINEFSQNLTRGLSDKLKQNENLKYFDISLDIQENEKPTIEIQSVSKIKEDTDSAFFNQTNLSSYNGETTINLGFGKRKLYKDETVMLGSNIFVDYQFDESHLRNGLGLEAISSVFDLVTVIFKN